MTQPRTMIERRVDAARAKRYHNVICQVPSGWVFMSDEQYTPGCCMLVPDPVAADINALDADTRTQFLNDMITIGDALIEVTNAYRINYEIRAELEPALYARIFPRYNNEPAQYHKLSAWYRYEAEKKLPPRFNLERDKPLMRKLANSILGKI
jgi:diadenosine tetraphosphate (Ap4A) HIT family hydrolase